MAEQYAVKLTDGAARDLTDLVSYIASHDSPASAEHVLDAVTAQIESLSKLPDRGVIVTELEALGIVEYREVFFKPYRIIYSVGQLLVYVHLIADGRRDMQTLLERRLFG